MTDRHPLELESATHAARCSATLREHLEAIAPGASGVLDREHLGQSPEEFKETVMLLADLEQAGALRLGTQTPDPQHPDVIKSVEFERII
jgi:hypothetical protein